MSDGAGRLSIHCGRAVGPFLHPLRWLRVFSHFVHGQHVLARLSCFGVFLDGEFDLEKLCIQVLTTLDLPSVTLRRSLTRPRPLVLYVNSYIVISLEPQKQVLRSQFNVWPNARCDSWVTILLSPRQLLPSEQGLTSRSVCEEKLQGVLHSALLRCVMPDVHNNCNRVLICDCCM